MAQKSPESNQQSIKSFFKRTGRIAKKTAAKRAHCDAFLALDKAHRDLELAIAREAELLVGEANAAHQADARRRATLAQIKSSRGIEIIDLNSRYFRRSETLAQIEAGDAEIVDIY